VLVTRYLDVTGDLDLRDGDMIVDYDPADGSPIAFITQLLQNGREGGSWTGEGINSSSAGSSGRYALGVGEASELGFDHFSGEAVDASAVLIKFTYAGDANLDGEINGDDYFAIDDHIRVGSGTWTQGNFNYDGQLDGDDYFLIDQNYPTQGPPL
jgi:hypothetical protein